MATMLATFGRARGGSLLKSYGRLASGTAMSPLGIAAAELRAAALTACQSGPSPANKLEETSVPPSGDWAEVRDQAAAVARWPSHPFQPSEIVSMAEVFANRAASVLGPASSETEADCGGRLCKFYEQLLEPGALIGPAQDGLTHCGLVTVSDEHLLGAASKEVVALLLRGHVVSLAAPKGPTLDAAKMLVDGFPSELLKAVEIGSMVMMPITVHAFRAVGSTSKELWVDKAPPADFGGFSSKSRHSQHGMAAAATPFTLARVDPTKLQGLPKREFTSCPEVEELVALLPSTHAVGKGGVDDARQLVDLLWAFREELADTDAQKPVVSLAPSHKHLLLTGGTEVPEDIIKAAMVAASSPFNEKVTLHAVGLGSRGLMRDPVKSFCRIVQSGKSGLTWQVKEHANWSSFADWLHLEAPEEADRPQLFSARRVLELELRRRCAEAGGVAWGRLFVPEPFDTLRRWTTVLEQVPSASGQARLRTE